ncbi:hypothetical protein D3C71_1715640 [compost metagenome]
MNTRPWHPGTPTAFILITCPGHTQVATDSERTVQFGRHLVINGRFEAIPVEGQRKDHQRNDDQQHNTAHPSERLSCFCHNGSLNAKLANN